MKGLKVIDVDPIIDLERRRLDALDALITAAELVGRSAERAFFAEPDDSVPDRHWRQNRDTHRVTRLRDFTRTAYEQANDAYHAALRERILEATLPGYAPGRPDKAKT